MNDKKDVFVPPVVPAPGVNPITLPLPFGEQTLPQKDEPDIKNPIVRSMVNGQKSAYDPDGSYTGAPLDKGEKPTQDADDL